MDLDDCTVEADRLDLDTDELLLLQFLEQPIQHTGFCPAIHACVDRMPIAKAFRQAAPLATILCDVQDRVDDLEIAERDVAALYRQERLNPTELRCGDFHES